MPRGKRCLPGQINSYLGIVISGLLPEKRNDTCFIRYFLVLLTFVILLFTLRERVASVRKGDVSLSYYSMFQGEEIPDMVQKTNRHFANLFEVPVLFYGAGILHIAMEMTDPALVILAWSFVAARVIHTCIHLGYNNVMHRLVMFGFGNVSVLGVWILIVSSAT